MDFTDDEQPRKRGRPRKTTKSSKTSKNINLDELKIEPEGIVMELKIPSSYKNEKDDYNEETNCFTAHESEFFTEEPERHSKKTTIAALTEEIKKKDEEIKKLKLSVANMKNNVDYDNSISITKEHTQTLMNLDLVHVTNGESIVVDKTNICCWWCTYNFDTLPCFLPDRRCGKKYYVFGNFCCFSCAMAYNDDLFDYRTTIRKALLKDFYMMIFKNEKGLAMLQSSPKRESLKKFGGNIEHRDFTNLSNLNKKDFKIAIPPIVYLVPTLESRTIDVIKKYSTTDNKLSAITDPLNELMSKSSKKSNKH